MSVSVAVWDCILSRDLSCPFGSIRRTNVRGYSVETGNALLPSRKTGGLAIKSNFTPFSLSAQTENTLAPKLGTINTSRWTGTNSPRSFRTRNARVPFVLAVVTPQDPLTRIQQSSCLPHVGIAGIRRVPYDLTLLYQ